MSAFNPSAWATSDNPDYLALLLYGLHNLDDRQSPLPQAAVGSANVDDKLLKRYAPVLDSLARLLVHQKGQPVVAVAFRPAGEFEEKPPAFIIAQNRNVETKLKDRLKSLLDHLRTIYQLRRSIYGSSSPPTLNEAEVSLEEDGRLEQACAAGECDVLYYSYRKIQARFTKNNRHKSFLNLVAEVHGLPVDDRADFGENTAARESLKRLQDLGAADRNCLLRIGKVIKTMEEGFMQHNLSGEPQPTAADRFALVELQACCYNIAQRVSQSPSLWRLCNNYLRVWPKVRQHSHGVEAPFDVSKWLGKVVSVSRDYMQILHVTESPTMASKLFDGPPAEVEVVSVSNSLPPPVMPTISKDAIESTLEKAGWDDITHPQYQSFVDSLFQTLRQLLSAAASTTGADPAESTGDEEPVSGELRPYVHCECAVLAHLYNTGDIHRVIPYVGVSKPSCTLCSTYFECYRGATISTISTRETHSRLVPWQAPSLSVTDPLEEALIADFRKGLCGYFMEKLQFLAQVARARRSSSQSTAASQVGAHKFYQSPAGEDPNDFLARRMAAMAKYIAAGST